MTDPKVITDIISVVESLPDNAAIIYRHFRKSDRLKEATKLRQITFEKNQQFENQREEELRSELREFWKKRYG